ncbi:Manganese transporter SMF1 [Grifola frondosa]|uniref:Manganese transporter SMF1 n=1 Tax=Grifola frondosa TaxID=5627 RepID=A0A1C7MTB3_GRIFR|nr:Manganese transporter SMF1 [Grifola frondosa]
MSMLRRLLTRCLGLVPSLVVAAAIGRSGIDTLLVASQVVLSIVLPFIVFPLLWLTSSRNIMRVKNPASAVSQGEQHANTPDPATTSNVSDPRNVSEVPGQEAAEEFVDFSNGKVTIFLGYAIWLVVIMANVYAIVGLAMGQGS